MTKKKKTKAWVNKQSTDHFVQQAHRAGLRSRANFKLAAIQEQDKLIKPGMTVLDLGSAPGSWSEFASNIVGH